ncbi:MAG: mycothione reductase [Propionibacteriales bacterium]|nr:mycothione reductase [Propionibacteriales bacterium]
MRHFDLAIIGSGSGNTLIDEKLDDLDIALLSEGVFGGTCLNVGCIPTKMFVLPADLAASPAEAARLGVDLEFRGADWPGIRDRIFGRIDPISAGGEDWRRQNANVTLYREHARFIGERTLDTGTGEQITADRIVIAAGSRATIPDIAGIDQVTVHTSDTVMRLASLPKSMIIIGGGFISAEFAHIFSAYGTQVTVVNRSGLLLRQEDRDISTRFTELMGKRVGLRLDSTPDRLEALPDGGVRAHFGGDTLDAEVLLVATGRVPNGDRLDLASTGVDLDDDGYVVVDDHQLTTAEGIFALGDVSSPYQLKHVANHEARVVKHNLLHPDSMISSDHRFVPHAVFSDPQVASVGLTEEQAVEQGAEFVTAVQEYGSVAYGWAMEDVDHVTKLLAEPRTGRLLGAHIMGPQASTLIQPLIQAMTFGLTAGEMAHGQYWIHPALPEVVENALLALPLD